MKWRYLILIIVGLGFFALKNLDATFDHSSEKSLSTSAARTQVQNAIAAEPAAVDTQDQEVSVERLPILDWVKSEAQKMETHSFDPVFEEAQLRNQASRLSTDEVQVLKNTALSTEARANERILSAYLLSQSASKSLKALQEIATSELSVKGVLDPHSLDETQSMHEKALRRMALDELFRRAIVDSSYRDQLAREIEKIPVPELKSYAKNRFQELFGQY